MEFKTLRKMDAHLHFNVPNEYVLRLAQNNNFQLITVNVDFPEFGTVSQQLTIARELYLKAGEQLRFIASFSMVNWLEADWTERTIASIREALYQGAIGVKIWKNIGMTVRDAQGDLIGIDDSRLDPVFNFLERENIPLMMHQAEPKNCWLPLEEMTMRYDREFFTAHPQQHMYLFPDMPSYESLIAARDRRLKKHSNLVTIQAHLGSMEWDVDVVAQFLQSFPKAYVDTAARINHLMYQARADWEKVRDFFIRYQDRILYATDYFITSPDNAKLADGLKKQWLMEWRFLHAKEAMSTPEFEGSFNGLGLPENVLQKIYYKNALRAFPKLAQPLGALN